MAIENLLTVDEAAEIIGCTSGRVRQMLRDGELRGQKLHQQAWVVDREDAERKRDDVAKTGRPRKFKK